MIKSPDYREINGCEKKNGKIVGVSFKRRTDMESKYLTLEEIYEEDQIFKDEVKKGTKDQVENIIYTLPYLRRPNGSGANKFVCVVKIGDQYEIRDLYNTSVADSLDNLPDLIT